MIEFEITVDNSQIILDQLERKADEILERIGAKAVGYAVGLVPTDTGLLKNSLTWAVAGKQPDITTYHADRANRNGTIMAGKYDGVAPGHDHSVYIGSNVEYAPYVEMGVKSRANYPKQPYLQPAIENHKAEYEGIANDVLQTIHT